MALTVFRAGEAISAGDAVYVDSSSFLRRAVATTFAEASVVGLAIDAASAGQPVRVNTDGIYTGLSALTPGDFVFLSYLSPGQLVSFADWETAISTVAFNPFLARVGRAITPTSLEIETSRPVAFVNPTSILLLESSTGTQLDALLLEDGSFIDLEAA